MDSSTVKPRSVAIVACYIASQLPKDQIEFKEEIQYLLGQFAYVAPEDLLFGNKWILLQDIMYRFIPIIDASWKQTIVDIFIGKTPVPLDEKQFYLHDS